MGRTTKKEQIRVFVDREQLQILKLKAKELGLELQHYAGLVLSGYNLSKNA